MFAPLPTPREMQAWDRAAIQLGMPEMLLMEHAGKAAASTVFDTFGPVHGKRALLFMGTGNNGGDAACMGRHLRDNGAHVLVLHSRSIGHYRGTAMRHLRLARACGVQFAPVAGWPERLKNSQWLHPDIVVDGLLGTGFSGILREKETALVSHINQLRLGGSFVLALDIPSGLNALTGQPAPIAVRATATATFAAAKPGLVIPEAAEYVGDLHICPIGIPLSVREAHPPSCVMMLPSLLEQLPQPALTQHKGHAGHVLVLGGSPGLTGAPVLAALGALRTGAGLVTIGTPATLPMDAQIPPDVMNFQVGETWNTLSVPALRTFMQQIDTLVLGPGIGRSAAAVEAVEIILSIHDRPPTIIDADALQALATRPKLLGLLRSTDILTPHPGEAARLLNVNAPHKIVNHTVQADRLKALHALTELAPSLWILKGAGTLVGRKHDLTSLCPLSAPNLAVGGAGDVLAGCIAALLAQGMPPELASCCGVYLHARAGQMLAHRYPRRGNTAADIADALAWPM